MKTISLCNQVTYAIKEKVILKCTNYIPATFDMIKSVFGEPIQEGLVL